MRRAMLLLPLSTLCVAAYDDDRGPGIAPRTQGGRMVYPVEGFDAVGLGSAAAVVVRVGPGWSVEATGPAAAFADVRVTRQGRSLEIGRRYRNRPADPLAERQLRFAVTMRRIAAAAVGGSGRMLVDRAIGERFEAAVGGSGDLTVGALAVREARVALGGAGSVTARGRAEQLIVSVGGSGRVDAAGLRAARADVSIGGSGSVRADVAGPAQVSVAGSGDVDLGPAAHCTVSRVGSGRVRCGG